MLLTKIRNALLVQVPDFPNRCRICFSHTKNRQYTLAIKPAPAYHVKFKTLTFAVCAHCGFYFSAQNFNDYTNNNRGIFRAKKTPRLGDGVEPGREYYMAQSVIEVLGRNELSVAVLGAGLSRDHELIRQHPAVARCSVLDLVNFQESDYFEPLTTKRRFDVIVACEVFEHFVHPRFELARCLRLLQSGGMLVASTNLNAASDISKQAYPFLYGHTSHYSSRSIAVLAQIVGAQVRLVRPEFAKISPAKRYLYFTKSTATAALLDQYLMRTPIPPSEPVEHYQLEG